MKHSMAPYILVGGRAAKVTRPKHDIPALVKALRQRLGLTQEQFAQTVGVTYSTVNHWENAKRIPQPYLVLWLLEMKDGMDGQKST